VCRLGAFSLLSPRFSGFPLFSLLPFSGVYSMWHVHNCDLVRTTRGRKAALLSSSNGTFSRIALRASRDFFLLDAVRLSALSLHCQGADTDCQFQKSGTSEPLVTLQSGPFLCTENITHQTRRSLRCPTLAEPTRTRSKLLCSSGGLWSQAPVDPQNICSGWCKCARRCHGDAT
jgi:hypothetical protein